MRQGIYVDCFLFFCFICFSCMHLGWKSEACFAKMMLEVTWNCGLVKRGGCTKLKHLFLFLLQQAAYSWSAYDLKVYVNINNLWGYCAFIVRWILIFLWINNISSSNIHVFDFASRIHILELLFSNVCNRRNRFFVQAFIAVFKCSENQSNHSKNNASKFYNRINIQNPCDERKKARKKLFWVRTCLILKF